MNRRGFLSLFGAAIAGAAVDQIIPLGRVWSFPKEIVIAPAAVLPEIAGGNLFLNTTWITMETLRILKNNLKWPEFFDPAFTASYLAARTVGAIDLTYDPPVGAVALEPDARCGALVPCGQDDRAIRRAINCYSIPVR
jgi:hypothetical protein